MTKDETIELIEHMRAAGACRVRVGDVEVQWATPPIAVSAPAERLRPEEVARLRRERDEAILFAASG